MSGAKRTDDDSSMLKPLSSSGLKQLIFAANEGEANAAEVRQALAMFHDLAAENRAIPRLLIDFVAASFGRYLGRDYFHGPKTRRAASLNSAFGLVRKKGRPRVDEQRRIGMAAEVVRLRVGGAPHQEAVEAVAEAFGCEKTIIGQAFGEHRLSGVASFRNSHPGSLTPDEKLALERMLEGQPDILSGKISDLGGVTQRS